MHALIQHQFGDPTTVLATEEVETPEPGPGQARVRLLLSPIHNHDLWTVTGNYGFKPEMPARAGTEAVGVVEAVGSDVAHLQVGQRVASAGTFGVWAEEFVAEAATLIPVPDSIPDEVAAQLVSMPFSAISLLDSLNLAEGDWMIINAANGAVGRLVAQLAPKRGINVVGLVRRAEGVSELEALGVTGIVATDSEGWQQRVAEITGGADLKVGVEQVGGQAAGDMLDLLAENGELVVFGAMASPELSLKSGQIIFKQATVRGFWGSKVSATMAADDRARLMQELFARISDGTISLPVEATFGLAEIADATRAHFTPGRAGKVLLRP
ncbi:zinc-binding dehydrogenase [Demequina sp. NBRC 110051]|uniref:zinc-binding dehydrogenase n=1 Tax=Demequina sp. NBRC 110051 TaxID=1570340 RepID=UPI000A001429|nr:zinc-binding dehydrogenase [Demequina sp. NBRC 110051]